MKNPVNWFEIPVTDMDRAKAFYEKVFNIEFSMVESPNSVMAMFPSNMEEFGAAGCLDFSDYSQPSDSGVTVYFSCENLNDELGRAKNLGAEILVPRTSIGEHGFFAHFKDTEGNRIALHSLK